MPQIKTSVRCFRRLQDEVCKTRRGVWLMESDRVGIFFHGDREEAQKPRHTLAGLLSGSLPYEVQEITAEAAIAELASWPDAVEAAVGIFERNPQ